MSERILKALLQLFAIVARVDLSQKEELSGRQILESFLLERLPRKLVTQYLEQFDKYLEAYQRISAVENGRQKRTAVNSVKILRICTQINEELTQSQKTIVLIRLLEFIHIQDEVSDLEEEFLEIVASAFNLPMDEYALARSFVKELESGLQKSTNVMLLSAERNPEVTYKSLYCEGLEGTIRILRLPSVNMHFLKYNGTVKAYQLSGQVIKNDRFYILNQGTSIRGAKLKPVYYSDIIGNFLKDADYEKILYRATGVEYRFANGNNGLQEINFQEESGKLVGIMGGSGSGKSTLLNVLNGNLRPTKGTVSLNGVDVHREPHKLEGLIGYVAQDDLLIDELTVFQNLYYNARLCFGQKSHEEVTALVEELLSTLGLADTRNLRVGNPLDKTISGGQRKRLNIALELIREPAVLFVDEPTSGLSSRDSENIMDLLKELSLKGKLIFVVIHQPSSDIFKMFDRLLVIDQGGYPIYNGQPVESLVYFKRMVSHINSDEAECTSCGNVKTEEIFNIIEAKVVDEYGNLTPQRKISPREWNNLYRAHIEKYDKFGESPARVPDNQFTLPHVLEQFRIFIVRDVLSKLSNRQYVLINLLEAPALALILAFFMRFFNPSGGELGYVYRENENIPVYIFIAVIVAIFIGLTVSSEEIIRDKKIRKREQFLNLSRHSYLFSKVSLMMAISAVQMLLFVLIGNYILEIQGMTFKYWFMLFSACVFANVLGLNISATFNSAKVIYIIIPIVIIPQLLFSGIIVKFDRLNPIFASQSGVPWIGNIMASRWAYEALAVTQFKENEYERTFFDIERRKKFSNWKKDYWLTALKNKTTEISRMQPDEAGYTAMERELTVLRNELAKENRFLQGLAYERINDLTPERISDEVIQDLRNHLDKLTEHYKKTYLKADAEKEQTILALTQSKGSREAYQEHFNRYKNDQLEIFATNRNDVTYIAEHNGELIQKKDLIYLLPYNSTFFGSHFYAPAKKLFGRYIDTFYTNALVVWGMTFLLILCLFMDVFPRAMNAGNYLLELANVKHKKSGN
jgi:ABC-type multidrug transport system ATPase subunit